MICVHVHRNNMSICNNGIDSLGFGRGEAEAEAEAEGRREKEALCLSV